MTGSGNEEQKLPPTLQNILLPFLSVASRLSARPTGPSRSSDSAVLTLKQMGIVQILHEKICVCMKGIKRKSSDLLR
jgi:hypothetical protein